jgi:glyoxylate carboligase
VGRSNYSSHRKASITDEDPFSFSNGLPGLATAFADRSSIFCITSSAPLRDAESNCLQGMHDQVVVAKNITKFAHRVAQAEEIPRLVAHAFRVSVAGAPGMHNVIPSICSQLTLSHRTCPSRLPH